MLYLLSVLAIVACVNLVVAPICVAWMDLAEALSGPVLRRPLQIYALAPRGVYVGTTLVTLAVIALGTVEVLAKLSLGKGELAAMLSGRPVNRGTGRDDERRLVNIVDEMSIASGLPSPPLYVLNREKGINAFAAGESPSQAVVVVTQGAIEQLSRDELQAVIAHEFSHILNGDIRINLRAVYVLQGIVFLSAIGRFMMRYYSGAGTDEGRSFFHLPLAVLGAGVFAIGSVGLVFCRMIQAAISRERENLADASAVQLTRNADALCGALARIQVSSEGSRIMNWHGDALAHMLFAPNAQGWWRGLFSTHPGIEERMRRINPHVSPLFYLDKARKPRRREETNPSVPAERKEEQKPRTIVPARATGVAALIAAIGAPDANHLDYAHGLLAYLPESIRGALTDAEGAQAVMLGCVVEAELASREAQLRVITQLRGEALARKAEVLAPLIRQLDRAYRLPLVALAIPTLKALDDKARGEFLTALRAAIEADRRFTLSEFVLATLLDWTLGERAKRSGTVKYKARGELAQEVALVLSLLSHVGGGEQAAAGFDAGVGVLEMPGLALRGQEALQLSRVTEALERLALLAPEEKARLLAGFAAAVAADGNVRLLEHELLRAVACALDCPMPPSVAALDPRLLRK